MSNVDNNDEATTLTVGALKALFVQHDLKDNDLVLIGLKVPNDDEDDYDDDDDDELPTGTGEDETESEEFELDVYEIDFNDVQTNPDDGRKALLLGADLTDTDEDDEEGDEEE